ncbi:MAG: substrate-binding domain-containing protein [Planctomycetales bacterium]|nr:substrate-binding domain-containing protein [Planctomycetales bacterium]
MLRRSILRWLALSLLLCGCNSSSNSAGDAASGDAAQPQTQRMIGASLLNLQNPFFQVIGDNMTAEAAQHGYGVTVLSADDDIVKQGHQVKDFIVSGVSAIVLSPCQVDQIGPIIREANEAGIPVFTVDIPCYLPDVKIECQIASDNVGGGRQAAQAMIEALGEAGGKIGILHFRQAESCQLRVQGFQEVIDAHNQSSPAKIEIVDTPEGGGQKAVGASATETMLQAHPDLQGIFAINDPSALGALAALEKAGKADQVTLIGFDGQPDAKLAVREGKLLGTPEQFPDQMGIEIVRAIVAHSKGEDLPAEKLIPTRLYTQEIANSEATTN